MEAMSLYPVNKVGNGLTVTEIMEFMVSLAENDDIELYNIDVKRNLLDDYSDKTQFCSSHRVVEKGDFL